MLPYSRYLKYLISLQLEPKKIIMKLHKFGFDVERGTVDRIAKDLMLPEIYSKFADGEEVDEEYLIEYAYQNSIGPFWEYKLKGTPKELSEAFLMMEDPKARIIPVILAVKGEKLPFKCMQELGYEYSKEAVYLLLKLFFNIEETSFMDFKEFFPDSISELLEKPLEYIKYKMQINPKLEYSNILEDLMHLSYYKSVDLLRENIHTKDEINMAKKLADISIKAGEKLQKYNQKDIDSFLDDIIVEFDKTGMELGEVEEIDEGGQIELI